MILRTPVILGVCWWIGFSSAIPFRKTEKNIEEDIRQDKYNYGSTEEEYYNSESSEAYPNADENYPNRQKTSEDISRSSSDDSQTSQEISRGSRDGDPVSDSAEDYSQNSSNYSDEDGNSEEKNPSTTSKPTDSPVTEPVEHLPEKNIEKWIPTNCTRSARKSSDRYSSSFVSNNTKDDLNEDTFPNPGETEAIKRSSVFVGEDVTLCWIETITIKEDKSIKPSKKVVLREFTISFENSATIPEKYLECGKLEGEVEPGCHENSGMFDVIDEDSKVSKMVNFTTISNKGNIEVRQHKNVRCAVGPVVTKNVIEFRDGSKNPKKRVEVKVSPRLRKMGETGESCPSAKEEDVKVPEKTKPGPDGIDEKLEEVGSTTIRPKKPKTILEPIDGGSTTFKDETPDVESTSTLEPSRPEEVEEINTDISTTERKNFEDGRYSSTPETESVGEDEKEEKTEKTPVLKEETTTTPKGIEQKEGNGSSDESKYCEGDSCEGCSGEDCSKDSGSVEDSTTEETVRRQTSTTETNDDFLRESSTKHRYIPSKDDKKSKTGQEKSSTKAPSNVNETPSGKELGALPTRKSSSGDVPSTDIEIGSSTPVTQESDSKKREDVTGIPESSKDGSTKRPKHISPHSLIREEGPKKDLKCESGSCSKSLEGSTKPDTEPSDVSKPENASKLPKDGTESSEDSLESPEDLFESYRSTPKSSAHRPKSSSESPESSTKSPEISTKFPKSVPKSKLISRPKESSEEASGSPLSTTKAAEAVTNSTEHTSKSTKHPESTTNSSSGLSTSEATTEFFDGVTNYPKGRSKPEDMGEDAFKDLEKTSTLKPKTPEKKKHKKKERKHEPDDIGEMTDIYSDEEETTSQTPSFLKTTTPPSTKQPRKMIENPPSELKNRSGEEFPNAVPKTSTEPSQVEKTTTEPVADDCNSENSESCTSASKEIKRNQDESEQEKEIDEGKESEEVIESEKVIEKVKEKEKIKENKEDEISNQSSTPSNPEAELAVNKSIPDASDEKTVPELSSRGKHKLGLRIKIILEHINEKEEKNNLVEVDKHLLLNEDAKEHDNNTILNQIKALNDSVTAKTIKALLNCTTLEKLANKGVSIKVNEATLLPKEKENSKNVEPNEFILSLEDKNDGVDKLRNKRETRINTKENSTIASSTENLTDANSTEKNSTTEINPIEANNTSKNQSKIIKDFLPDLKEDINTGMNHVILKLNNCTTSNCFQKPDLNPLPISDILGIISDPKDSRTGSKNKRQAVDYRKKKISLEKLDHWSNERVRRAAGGHLRSLTEFTIFKASE